MKLLSLPPLPIPIPACFKYGYFLNSQLFFFPDSKIFPSGFTQEKLDLHVVPPYCFIVRQETGHDFSTSPSDSKMSRFTVCTLSNLLRIYGVFFSTLENGYKTAECVLTEASSGKKKLQIKNILGQDLNDVFFSHEFTNLVIIFALTKCHE